MTCNVFGGTLNPTLLVRTTTTHNDSIAQVAVMCKILLKSILKIQKKCSDKSFLKIQNKIVFSK